MKLIKADPSQFMVNFDLTEDGCLPRDKWIHVTACSEMDALKQAMEQVADSKPPLAHVSKGVYRHERTGTPAITQSYRLDWC